MKFLLVLLSVGFISSLLCPNADCAKILAIYPSFIRSHLTVAEGILEELMERGHEVIEFKESPMTFTNRVTALPLSPRSLLSVPFASTTAE